MMTFACLAAAGLTMGLFFNSYALLASCLATAAATLMSAFQVGLGRAAISMIVCLALLQVSYLIGLFASSFLDAPITASVPDSKA
jgi:hypothetical protein